MKIEIIKMPSSPIARLSKYIHSNFMEVLEENKPTFSHPASGFRSVIELTQDDLHKHEIYNVNIFTLIKLHIQIARDRILYYNNDFVIESIRVKIFKYTIIPKCQTTSIYEEKGIKVVLDFSKERGI